MAGNVKYTEHEYHFLARLFLNRVHFVNLKDRTAFYKLTKRHGAASVRLALANLATHVGGKGADMPNIAAGLVRAFDSVLAGGR
jgi:hypothetical protein